MNLESSLAITLFILKLSSRNVSITYGNDYKHVSMYFLMQINTFIFQIPCSANIIRNKKSNIIIETLAYFQFNKYNQ